MTKRLLVAIVACTGMAAASADTPETFMARYAKEAGVPVASLSGERGAAFYRSEHRAATGEAISCATCHTANPKQAGRTRIGKRIEPLAPWANPERFTDAAKVEKWFRRNCHDVLQRACSAQEKGDFIAWLNQVK